MVNLSYMQIANWKSIFSVRFGKKIDLIALPFIGKKKSHSYISHTENQLPFLTKDSTQLTKNAQQLKIYLFGLNSLYTLQVKYRSMLLIICSCKRWSPDIKNCKKAVTDRVKSKPRPKDICRLYVSICVGRMQCLLVN